MAGQPESRRTRPPLTEEQREHSRQRAASRRAAMTPAQREYKRARNQENARRRRAGTSENERRANAQRAAHKRTNMTDEQREAVRDQQRERERERRQRAAVHAAFPALLHGPPPLRTTCSSEQGNIGGNIDNNMQATARQVPLYAVSAQLGSPLNAMLPKCLLLIKRLLHSK